MRFGATPGGCHFLTADIVDRTGMADWAFAFMSYGDRWRARHRLCHEVLNGRLAGSFDDHHYKYTYRFLSRLLEEPEDFFQETELYVASYYHSPKPYANAYPNPRSTPGAIILSVTYGIDPTPTDDPFLGAAIEASRALATAMIPGKFLVDAIPMCGCPHTQRAPKSR